LAGLSTEQEEAKVPPIGISHLCISMGTRHSGRKLAKGNNFDTQVSEMVFH
jgi:hypothetical protein